MPFSTWSVSIHGSRPTSTWSHPHNTLRTSSRLSTYILYTLPATPDIIISSSHYLEAASHRWNHLQGRETVFTQLPIPYCLAGNRCLAKFCGSDWEGKRSEIKIETDVSIQVSWRTDSKFPSRWVWLIFTMSQFTFWFFVFCISLKHH